MRLIRCQVLLHNAKAMMGGDVHQACCCLVLLLIYSGLFPVQCWSMLAGLSTLSITCYLASFNVLVF